MQGAGYSNEAIEAAKNAINDAMTQAEASRTFENVEEFDRIDWGVGTRKKWVDPSIDSSGGSCHRENLCYKIGLSRDDINNLKL